MTEVKSESVPQRSEGPTSTPSSASEPAPKVKQTRTPKQLEQLAAAREKRRQKRQNNAGSITRSGSADEFIRRIERAEPEAREKKPSSHGTKRKREARGISFKSPGSYAIGAVALGALGLVAYGAKKKGTGSFFGPNTKTNQPPTGPPQPPSNLNTSNLFG